MVYARHGRELMGCLFDRSQGKGSPLYVNPVNMLNILTKVLAEGKGGTVRNRPEEASGKAMSPDFIGTYKAQSPGKSAPHDETPDSGDRVNASVV
jgi:hypothetical protein